MLKQHRPKILAREFKLVERTDGSPIVDFIRIEPSRFFMGDSDHAVLITITRPLEFMSVDVTQRTFQTVTELAGTPHMILDSLKLKGDQLPIYGVSYQEASLWIEELNQLSREGHEEIQSTLQILFHGHQKGDL